VDVFFWNTVYSQLISDADESFLKRIITYDGHVPQSLLPDRAVRAAVSYSLRERSHNKTLIHKTTYHNDDDFLIRMLYKDLYYQSIHFYFPLNNLSELRHSLINEYLCM